jgi:phospholipid/cholesterol/gamma-HCH transport system substrate-binding protein
MGQLDANKESIVTALENVNRLSLELRRQDGTIKQALDDLPAAIKSVNGQRTDLVKMLQALSRLSGVGVRVIQASKESTIDALRNLSPVLAALAKAGQNFPKSLQVFLTYPFIDEAVGRDPEVARNLHMGDFTNLSISLSLDLFNLPSIPGLAPGVSIADVVDTCNKTPLAPVCTTLKGLVLNNKALTPLCGLIAALCAGSQQNGGGGLPNPSGGGLLGGLTGGLTGGKASTDTTTSGGGLLSPLFNGLSGLLGRGRTAPNPGYDPLAPEDPFLLQATGYDASIGTLLMQGVAVK